MAMDTIVNRGFIKMHADAMKSRNNRFRLVIYFALSSCKLDDRERQLINKIASEKNFKKILAADVEPHFKIAKILCNQLGWGLDFDANRDLRYKLVIPLNEAPSAGEELALAEEDVEINNGEDESYLAPGL